MPQVDTDALTTTHQRSILLGSNALVDVSGYVVSALDAQGRRYGKVGDGGSIVIGGALDPATGRAAAPDLFVQLKAGSRLEASGAQAVLDIRGAGPMTLASNGGSISLSSLNGLYLDGDLRAASGGHGAAGGSLTVALETAAYDSAQLGSDAPLAPRELLINQRRRSLDDASGALAYGQGNLSVEQVDAGGFGNLALLSNGQISFDGDVDLALGQSLQLYSASLGLAEGSAADTRVMLSAPYVRLAEAARNNNGSPGLTVPVVRGGSSTQATQAQLVVASQLLDIRDEVNLGAHGDITLLSGQLQLDQRGFATMDVRSAGDMRMLRPSSRTISFTRLNTPGDLNLTVAQLYPETLARAEIRARHLSIGRSSARTPACPIRPMAACCCPPRASIRVGWFVRPRAAWCWASAMARKITAQSFACCPAA